MNTPTTILIETMDNQRLPSNMLAVLLKNVFLYGRTGITINGDACYLHLNYCPKRETVERKLRSLPVKYMRVFADNEEEFRILLKGLELFGEFRHQIEEEETLAVMPPPPLPSSPHYSDPSQQVDHIQTQQQQQQQQPGLSSKNKGKQRGQKRRATTPVTIPKKMVAPEPPKFITPDLTIELEGNDSLFDIINNNT